MAHEAPDPAVVARAAFDTLVYAPLGLGAKLVEDAPTTLRRMRQELNNARFIGRLTVEQGAARLRERTAATPSPERPTSTRRSASAPASIVPDPGPGLAIEGYDDMAAIEIVDRLEALSPAERDAIAQHESEHRQRRTVLGKIAQLAADTNA